MSIRFRQIAAAALASIAFAGTTAQADPVYTGLYIFGDSLTDTGNVAALFDSGAVPGVAPGTRTPSAAITNAFVPSAPYAGSNNFSNGPVFSNYIATLTGFPATPSLLGGNNFGFGGATTYPRPGQPPFSLTEQVGQLLARTPTGTLDKGALYVIVGGGNDARAAIGAAAAAIGAGQDPNAAAAPIIADYVKNISGVLTNLHKAGAEKFLFLNVTDVGKTPAALASGPQGSALSSAIAAAFNNAFLPVLGTLGTSLLDELVYFDVYKLLNQIVASPASFGLKDASNACGNPLATVACADSFFWDGIHPTTTGYSVVASAAAGLLGYSVRTVAEPTSLALIAMVCLALVGVTRRRR